MEDITNKKINTFASVFPTSKPQFVFVVLIDEPQINPDITYMSIETAQDLN